MTELKLREIILNTRKPLIFRGFQNTWKCFDGTLESWCARFDESASELCVFEGMSRKHWNAPQWERNRAKVQIRCLDFLKHCNSTEEKTAWYSLDYMRAQEVPAACKDGVDFAYLGFPYLRDEATFWLSSTGANTPCHYDTYACNIVRQIYGRKSWLLFPPSTQLTKTRIPYEESSVYCLENFYSPTLKETEDLMRFEEHAYRCILEPGDVLIVPRQWWHYVESIETSLSVNAWVPLECDLEARIDELIVNFIMNRITANEKESVKRYMLNPNQLEQIIGDFELFAILQHFIDAGEHHSTSKLCDRKYNYQYLDEECVDEMLKDFPTIAVVERVKRPEYKEFLKINSKRYDSDLADCDNATTNFLKEALVNAICCPDVIQHIKTRFYKTIGKEKK